MQLQAQASGAIDLGHAFITAVLQGITELFPVSSLGHAVLLPHLLGCSRAPSARESRHLLLLLVLGTIPAGLLGLLLEKRLEALFANYRFAAASLELPRLAAPEARANLAPALLGGVVSGVLAYASTFVLMRYFKRQEF